MRVIAGVVGCAVFGLVACSSSAQQPTRTSSPPPSPSSTDQLPLSSRLASSPDTSNLQQPDARTALETGDAPQNPFPAYGSLWIPAHHGGSVIRVDLRTGKHLIRIKTGDHPGAIGVGAGKVWVSHYGLPGLLVGIDPATNKVALRVRLPGESCCQPAVVGSTVWVTAVDDAGPGIVAVDAATGHIGKRIAGVDGPVVVGGTLWASQNGTPVIVDTAGGTFTPTTAPPGLGINSAPPAQGLTWAWDAVNGAAIGLTSDGKLGRTVKGPAGASLGGSDGMVITSADTVWVTDGTYTVWRIDAGSDSAVMVARTAQDLLCIGGDGRGGVWVTFFGADKVQHFSGTG
jgi:hypothetical protein